MLYRFEKYKRQQLIEDLKRYRRLRDFVTFLDMMDVGLLFVSLWRGAGCISSPTAP